MNRLRIHPTPLAGLLCVQRQQMGDARGHLTRLFCADELGAVGWRGPVAQVNHARTAVQGTVRGLHFQTPPHAELKLVSCLRGAVWDVAVDLRMGSPTFLQWHAQTLSEQNLHALLIPQGFAHGFQALTDDVELLYCHSQPFSLAADAGLNPMDPRLAVAWPLPVSLMSDKDRLRPAIGEDFEGVLL